MNISETKTLLHLPFCDVLPRKTISLNLAKEIFYFFKNDKLFRWQDANNDCEDRANAISLLLDAWAIPNAKAWIFGDRILQKGFGCLLNNWKYHVAAALPVWENDAVQYLVVDPSTAGDIASMQFWANNITDTPYSLHFIKDPQYYIFSSHKIEPDNWHKRDKRNLNWTMHGLSGINGVSRIGRAQLAFNKHRINATVKTFKKMMLTNPFLEYGLNNLLPLT